MKYKFYNSKDSANPYKNDFVKSYLYDSERNCALSDEKQKNDIIQTFLTQIDSSLLDYKDEISLTIRAFIFATALHISQITAFNLSDESILLSAQNRYKEFIEQYAN